MDSGERTGYEDEPEEVFAPLPDDLYGSFYRLERSSRRLTAEIAYYRGWLAQTTGPVLDLGCGPGLLAEPLAGPGMTIIAVDISRSMLTSVRQIPGVSAVQMDMVELGFRPGIGAAICAQNTLNLLPDRAAVRRCLTGIRQLLPAPGLLLLHLWVLDAATAGAPPGRELQFDIMEHPRGGRIVRESIRRYLPEAGRLVLEQRYKVRRFDPALPDANYSRSEYLLAWPPSAWIELVEACGFAILARQSSFSGDRSPEDSATLLLAARSKHDRQ